MLIAYLQENANLFMNEYETFSCSMKIEMAVLLKDSRFSHKLESPGEETVGNHGRLCKRKWRYVV